MVMLQYVAVFILLCLCLNTFKGQYLLPSSDRKLYSLLLCFYYRI